MHYVSWEEISGQSKALGETYRCMSENAGTIRAMLEAPGEIVFLACGSSYWLSMSGARTFQLYTGRKATAIKAGDVVMNPGEYAKAFQSPILVCPSRSGRTTEQIEAVRIIREACGGAPVLSIVEYEDTDLEKIADFTIRLPWANDASVCQTRSFSCLYLAIVLISAFISRNVELLQGLQRYIEAAPGLHKRSAQAIEELVNSFTDFNYLISLGSGRQYGVAIEGAYIGIEMAILKASYYSVMELRHGPIVTVNENTLVAILSNGGAKGLEENMARDVLKHGGKVLAVVDEGGFANADWVFEMGGSYPAEATALYFVFLMQVFAYRQAMRLGLNPDAPGDLVPLVPYIKL